MQNLKHDLPSSYAIIDKRQFALFKLNNIFKKLVQK